MITRLFLTILLVLMVISLTIALLPWVYAVILITGGTI